MVHGPELPSIALSAEAQRLRGDRIELAEPTCPLRITAVVESITLLFTTLRALDDEEVVFRVPQNLFFQRIVRVSPGVCSASRRGVCWGCDT
jgi:small-conductance mechanosensitive channel